MLPSAGSRIIWISWTPSVSAFSHVCAHLLCHSALPVPTHRCCRAAITRCLYGRCTTTGRGTACTATASTTRTSVLPRSFESGRSFRLHATSPPELHFGFSLHLGSLPYHHKTPHHTHSHNHTHLHHISHFCSPPFFLPLSPFLSASAFHRLGSHRVTCFSPTPLPAAGSWVSRFAIRFYTGLITAPPHCITLSASALTRT